MSESEFNQNFKNFKNLRIEYDELRGLSTTNSCS